MGELPKQSFAHHIISYSNIHFLLITYIWYICKIPRTCILFIKLMKGKALRKHSLREKTAASVLLKLFISGNE